jgi:hypothetical protein
VQYGAMPTSAASTTDDLAELIGRAAGGDPDAPVDKKARQQALAALAPAVTRSARAAGFRAVAAGRWLTDQVIDLAPRVPVRDAARLQAQNPGLTDDQIAELLIRRATRITATFGAAAGGLAAAEFAAPAALIATPAQLAAEMLCVTAIELKLVAELHEIMGVPIRGTAGERAGGYLVAWMHRRAIRPQLGAAGLAAVFGVATKRELRNQVLRRFGRSTTTLAPFLAGAVAGAEVNRRATRALGESLLADLRGMRSDRWFHRLF